MRKCETFLLVTYRSSSCFSEKYPGSKREPHIPSAKSYCSESITLFFLTLAWAPPLVWGMMISTSIIKESVNLEREVFCQRLQHGHLSSIIHLSSWSNGQVDVFGFIWTSSILCSSSTHEDSEAYETSFSSEQ